MMERLRSHKSMLIKVVLMSTGVMVGTFMAETWGHRRSFGTAAIWAFVAWIFLVVVLSLFSLMVPVDGRRNPRNRR